jgi:hypothetical protein
VYTWGFSPQKALGLGADGKSPAVARRARIDDRAVEVQPTPKALTSEALKGLRVVKVGESAFRSRPRKFTSGTAAGLNHTVLLADPL